MPEFVLPGLGKVFVRSGGRADPGVFLLVASAFAWAVLAHAAARAEMPVLCMTGPVLQRIGGIVEAAIATGALWDFFAHWGTMVIAMMFPLLLPPARYVVFRSYAWRRHRAVLAFVAGYLLAWQSAGGVVAVILLVLRPSGTVPLVWRVAALAVAALWTLTAWRRTALRRCHRTVPLIPSGWRADWCCIRFGVAHGLSCLAACWALMVALLLSPAAASPVWMAALGVLSFIERALPRRSFTTWHVVVLSAMAVAALVP